MNQPPPESQPAAGSPAQPLPDGWLRRYPWATFVAPLAVFLLVGSLEPKPPALPAQGEDEATESASDAVGELTDLKEDDEDASDDAWLPSLPYRFYPAVYTAKIFLTVLAMLLVWPGYRTFPLHFNWLAIVVGVAGAGVWIALCKLNLEAAILRPLGLGGFLDTGQRSAFNPLEQMSETPLLAYAFLAVRLFGLAVVVPIIEEFFLRGFLMRFAIHDTWQEIPFGVVTRLSVVVGTAVPMLMHPGELLAAMFWFSLVTWLMVRTRNIWDCVAAHAATNLLLGVYVLASGDWHLM